MARGLVVGILPDDDVASIEGKLAELKLDLTKVSAVAQRGAASVAAPHELQMVLVDAHADVADRMTHGTGILSDGGGTSVPGLDARADTQVRDFGARRPNYLSAFDIPLDEIGNFNDAIYDGRAVLIYKDAAADLQPVAEAFLSAGLRNVHAY